MKKKDRLKLRKIVIFIILSAILFITLSVPSFAKDTGDMPDGYRDAVDSLGEEGAEHLKDGMYSDDPSVVGEAVSQMSDSRFWIEVVFDEIENRLSSTALLFAKLCGLLVLASVFGALGRSLSSDTLSGAVRFCTTTAIFAAIIHIQAEHLRSVEQFFGRLLAMMGTMIPVTGTVWAMGGNVGTASVGTSALYVFLNVCEGLCAKSLLPVCCLFTALALCNTLSPEMGLRGFSGTLKKIYTFFLGMIMTILMATLSSQTTLSAAADSTTARAARLVSSNVIPMVGGAVGDTLRTVATSVQYLKSVVGIGGIILILLLLLPVLISLILTRLVFLLCSGVAEMLGCDTESRFLSEIGGVYGIMIAVVSISSVMFIFALTVFSKTVVALG